MSNNAIDTPEEVLLVIGFVTVGVAIVLGFLYCCYTAFKCLRYNNKILNQSDLSDPFQRKVNEIPLYNPQEPDFNLIETPRVRKYDRYVVSPKGLISNNIISDCAELELRNKQNNVMIGNYID